MKSVLSLALLSSLLAFQPVHASELETGTIMICDTQKQAERVGEIFTGNAQAALNTVNLEEANPTACAMAEVDYAPGKVLGVIRSKSHTFRVVPVIVVGVTTPGGFQQVNSAVFFTLIQVREYAV